MNITPEVRAQSKASYLIRVDGDELGLVSNLEDTKLVIDSIANHEYNRLNKKGVKVFRQDLNDGLAVKISVQKLGTIYNSSVKTAVKIDCVSVGHLSLIKGRHERYTTPYEIVAFMGEECDTISSTEEEY